MPHLKPYLQSLVTEKIPDAFTLKKAEPRRKIPTGVQPLDLLIQGFQRGDLTEIHGQGSSGRTTLAISFMAEVTQRAEACALVDASDSLDPESLSVAGVDLNQLLWIRCGKTGNALPDSSPMDQFNARSRQGHLIPRLSSAYESSFSPGQHPRYEARGLSKAIATLMRSDLSSPLTCPAGSLSPTGRGKGNGRTYSAGDNLIDKSPQNRVRRPSSQTKIWKRLEQALRATDLLLNNGGFGAVVVDLGSIPPENARRIPLTSWFRFRRSVENTPTALVLLSKEPCCGTCASLVLHCQNHHVRWLSVSGPTAHSYMLILEGLDLAAGKARCRGQSQIEVMSGSSLANSVHWQTLMSWARG